MSTKKKKYSFYYRIYRRLRYLRYLKKLKREESRTNKEKEVLNSREIRRKARKQFKAERLADKEKRKLERLEMIRAKEMLKSDFAKDLEQNADQYKKDIEEKNTSLKRERFYRKRRRKKLLKFYAKTCVRKTIRGIKNLNPLRLPALIRYIGENRSKLIDLLVISTHSTLLFAAAYFMIFLISLLASAISGLFFEYSSKIYYNEVLWLVGNDQWYGDSVKMIYSSGPILVSIIAVFLAIIFSYIRTDRGLAKIFILWSFLHGFNAFFGSLLIGSMFGKGFGYAIIWAYISDTEKVVYSIVSITALILIGVFTGKSFLISANTYYSHLEKKQQSAFIWAQVGIPFILGNMLIGLIMLPKILIYDMTVSLTLAICIIPIFISSRISHSLYFEEGKVKITFRMKTIFYAIAFMFLYRLILGVGIPMG